MTRIVAPHDESRKWELPEDPHTRKMPFARAVHTASYGRSSAIAARLQRTGSLVGAWTDPERSNVPPNQRLCEFICAALAEGISPHDALEPLHHLNAFFGLEVMPRLPVLGTIGVENALAASMREAAQAFALVAEALPGGISPFEAQRCRKELREHRATLDQIEAELDAHVPPVAG